MTATIICLYVLLSKAYELGYYLVKRNYDIPVLLSSLIIIFSCVLIPLYSWRIVKTIRHKLCLLLFSIGSLYVQLYVGIYVFLSKGTNSIQHRFLWSVDVSNLLSIIILIAVIIIIYNAPKSIKRQGEKD